MFLTKEDLEAYLNQDMIQCLICYGRFYSLGRHTREHGLSIKQYKQKFGIPNNRSLVGLELKRSKRALKLMKETGWPECWVCGAIDG